MLFGVNDILLLLLLSPIPQQGPWTGTVLATRLLGLPDQQMSGGGHAMAALLAAHGYNDV